ncbi:hypothetical protein PSTT_04717 [Puccinia striiformis]|uniref:Uncharacterized protein n=1 Tax=Puccinia striiformis TaxID=27350 RepID=A0A2S4VRJ4_9BASI|nr:hypothetical protein PSTT_04717 [Puccinia striiformis]
MKQSIVCALAVFQLIGQISCKPLPTSNLPTTSGDASLFPRDDRFNLRQRHRRTQSTCVNLKIDVNFFPSTEGTSKTLGTNVRQVAVKNTVDDVAVQEAAKALALATKNVDDLILILQNPQASEDDIRKAAQEALKNEANEDFPRETLASAARNTTEAQGALAIIRDHGPTVVAAFKDIEKNSKDKAKVIESLKQILLARLQVVAANNDLIGGTPGGDRQLIFTSQISPSQLAIGTKLDDNQRKVVQEAQSNLAAQTKKVDEAVAVIQKQGSTPQEIEAAAKEALIQEGEEDFAREVLASAASDGKVAMAALKAVKDHGPTEVIAGFKAIVADSKNADSVREEHRFSVSSASADSRAVQADKKLVASAKTSTAPATSDTIILTDESSDNDKRRLDTTAKANKDKDPKISAESDDKIEVTKKLLSRISGGSGQSVVLVGSAASRAKEQAAASAATPQIAP